MTHLRFNTLLEAAGLDPSDVRLLRHQKARSGQGSPYTLWRDNLPAFEAYQSCQRADRASRFNARYWAAFVVPPDGTTLFVGVYERGGRRSVPDGWADPLSKELLSLRHDRTCELHELRRLRRLEEYIGRLKVDWGEGTRTWVQRADSATGNKPIVELTRAFREEVFPGYVHLVTTLDALSTLPAGWMVALRAARGIYLLTCPRTREQYVGSATGADGFWGRWESYISSGHGGNEGLRSRDPADYQVSILEVSGSGASTDDILRAEQLWKQKLQSREMGLNRN